MFFIVKVRMWRGLMLLTMKNIVKLKQQILSAHHPQRFCLLEDLLHLRVKILVGCPFEPGIRAIVAEREGMWGG